MDVFTQVTSHPTISKGVKHLFYDTARFHHSLPEDTYYELLRHDFHLKSSYMTSRNVSNAAYDDLSNLMLEAEAEYVDTDIPNTKLGLWLCQSPVRSVTLDNSFAKHHRVGMDALHDVDLYGSAQPHTGRPDFERQEKCVSSHSTVRLVEATPHSYYKTRYAIVRNDGTRPVGSPLARSWPPQFLQPLISSSPALAEWKWDQELSQGFQPEGRVELGTIIKLLKSAGRLHTVQQLRALRGALHTDAVSHLMLQMTDCGCMEFIEASTSLRILQLDIECLQYNEFNFNMGILKSFLGNASCLQEMLSGFQLYPDRNGNLAAAELLLSSTEMFPPFLKWKVPNLRRLKLTGVSFAFRELSGLLFIELAQLKSLTFRWLELTDGHWEDIIEGLSRLVQLSYCDIGYGIILESSGAYAIDEGISDLYRGDHFAKVTDEIDHYILHGGRHPLLPENAPDTASSQYLTRLDQTLEELSEYARDCCKEKLPEVISTWDYHCVA
ncbi:MAG: hypothetical protein Q9198_004045 [Flavoplaca austrocitrina]